MNRFDEPSHTLPGRDSLEFTVAFLVGAALGAWAARSLRPERGPVKRIRRKVKGPAAQVRRQGRRTRASAGETAGHGAKLGAELRDLGAEFVDAAATEFGRMRAKESRASSVSSSALSGLRSLRSRLSPDR